MLIESILVIVASAFFAWIVNRVVKLSNQHRMYVPSAKERARLHANEVTQAYRGQLSRINRKARKNLLTILFRAGKGKNVTRHIGKRMKLRDQRDIVKKSWARDIRNIMNRPDQKFKQQGIRRQGHERGRWWE